MVDLDSLRLLFEQHHSHLMSLKKDLREDMSAIKSDINQGFGKYRKDLSEQDKRLKEVEKFQWKVAGVISFILVAVEIGIKLIDKFIR